MDLAKYDDLIARILEEERQIYPFLDVIFGFLWRRTDFFVVQKEGGKLGFPPGGAEKIVWSIFNKWKNLSRGDSTKTTSQEKRVKIVEDFPECMPVAQEEVVVTSMDDDSPGNVAEVQKTCGKTKMKSDVVSSSDIYNGADRGTYRWSQTIGDLEVVVPVPDYVRKSKDVNVSLTDNTLLVKIKDKSDTTKWSTVVDGEFCYKVNKEESVWSLSPGQQISIHCEKTQERWWDALLTSEPKLDTRKIDACRPMSELSEEEQMKVEELMWNEERKQLGLKTSEQIKAEKILKDAWNAKGSPFKGTEFDPSVLNFATNSMNTMDFQGNS